MQESSNQTIDGFSCASCSRLRVARVSVRWCWWKSGYQTRASPDPVSKSVRDGISQRTIDAFWGLRFRLGPQIDAEDHWFSCNWFLEIGQDFAAVGITLAAKISLGRRGKSICLIKPIWSLHHWFLKADVLDQSHVKVFNLLHRNYPWFPTLSLYLSVYSMS